MILQMPKSSGGIFSGACELPSGSLSDAPGNGTQAVPYNE